jgi:hypothetical protein
MMDSITTLGTLQRENQRTPQLVSKSVWISWLIFRSVTDFNVRFFFGENLGHNAFPAFAEVQPHTVVRHPTDFQHFAVRAENNCMFQSFVHAAHVGPGTASGQDWLAATPGSLVESFPSVSGSRLTCLPF